MGGLCFRLFLLSSLLVFLCFCLRFCLFVSPFLLLFACICLVVFLLVFACFCLCVCSCLLAFWRLFLLVFSYVSLYFGVVAGSDLVLRVVAVACGLSIVGLLL